METAPPYHSKYLRQITALLTLCGLRHWRDVLLQWIGHYVGLEGVVDDDSEGPQAAVIRLLRDINTSNLHPTDREFSDYLSELAFTHYRVRRVKNGFMFRMRELWEPLQQSLSDFRTGHVIGAWRALSPPVPQEVVAQKLLRQLQNGCDAGHTRY